MCTRSDRIFLLSLAILSAVQLLTLIYTPLTLSADEAYYWEWSRRLDLAYYSKGPVVALFIRVSSEFFGDTPFAVRFPAFLCSFVFSVAFYRFMRRETSAEIALLSWFAVRSMLIVAATSFVMTTDPPTLLFWWLALTTGYRAVQMNHPSWWTASCAWTALAVLTKYTAGLLFISLLAFLIVSPERRHHLRSLAFAIGVLVFTLFISPVVIWNAEHGWVNFSHNSSHLLSDRGITFRPRYLMELLGGQLGIVGPILLPAVGIAISRHIRDKNRDLRTRYLLFSVFPLLALCLVVSLMKNVYANWPMPAYLGGVILLGLALQEGSSADPLWRWCIRGVVLNWVLVVIAHLPLFGFTFGFPGDRLPTKKMVGWREVAAVVEEVREKVLHELGAPPFLLVDGYSTAASLAFALPDHPELFCAPIPGRRMNQYDIWGGLERQAGRSALLVLSEATVPPTLAERFEELRPFDSRPEIVVTYGGKAIRRFYLFVGKGYDGKVPQTSLRA